MSNLIIKGMEMPKHAIKSGTDDTLYRSCVIVHPDGTAELILDSTFADMFGFEHNLNRFPLVEIPTPHGDLIDRNAVINRAMNLGISHDPIVSVVMEATINVLLLAIKDIPAVINAEEKEARHE